MTMRKICEVLLLQSGWRCSKTIPQVKPAPLKWRQKDAEQAQLDGIGKMLVPPELRQLSPAQMPAMWRHLEKRPTIYSVSWPQNSVWAVSRRSVNGGDHLGEYLLLTAATEAAEQDWDRIGPAIADRMNRMIAPRIAEQKAQAAAAAEIDAWLIMRRRNETYGLRRHGPPLPPR